MRLAVHGRAVVVERLAMFPVECVARGYLTGSGLLDYRAGGEVCGIALPAGLEDGSRLPEPIFTPATKAELGDHDENVSYDAVVRTIGAGPAAELRDLTLAVYARAEEAARERGIILADTKLEFGSRPDGTTVWDPDTAVRTMYASLPDDTARALAGRVGQREEEAGGGRKYGEAGSRCRTNSKSGGSEAQRRGRR